MTICLATGVVRGPSYRRTTYGKPQPHARAPRLKGGFWQIEKRCKYAEGGWLRESTETSSRAEAEDVLIRRLVELKDIAERKAQRVFTFEEAALRYLEDIAHKPSAGTAAFHIDQVLPSIGDKVLAQVHDGTVKPFIDHELPRGTAPKSINNALAVVSAAELGELLAAAEKVTDRGIAQTPALTLIRRHAQGVGKVSEVKEKSREGPAACMSLRPT